jgi:WhiB family redox-sensing transcriptional regulator
LTLAVIDQSWRDLARCKGTDTERWVEHWADRGELARLRGYCAACPVRAECLDFALFTPCDHGIYGGTTPDERKQLRHALGLARPGRDVPRQGHGTESGAAWHRRNGEQPCRPCADAVAAAKRGRDAAARERQRQEVAASA